MITDGVTMFVSWHEEDGVIVVRFRQSRVITDEAVQVTGHELMEAVEAAKPTGRMLVDFEGLDVMSSALIGKLVLLNKMARSESITLKFCNLSPNIREVFQVTRLHKVFDVSSDSSTFEPTPFDEPFGAYLASRGMTWTGNRRAVLAVVDKLPHEFTAGDVLAADKDVLGSEAVYEVLFELWDAGLLGQEKTECETFYRKLLHE